MGRHSRPTLQDQPPAAPLRTVAVVALAVLGAAAVSVAAVVVLQGDSDVARTRSTGTPASSATSSAGATAATTATTGGDEPSDQPSGGAGEAAGAPPVLAFRVVTTCYITVRIPGERTLVSRLFRAGETRRFHRAPLEVVVGNSGGVRITVHGRPREPGLPGEVEKFTVRGR